MLIAGPTASGKSALAMAVAERLSGSAVVNADSMQIYRDLSVVTARPNLEDQAEVDHFLYGYVDGADAYSAARWRDDAAGVLKAEKGRPLVVVGGTGLYFRALTIGLSPIPQVPDAVRQQVRRDLAEKGAPALHAQLDAAMADQLSPSDGQRVARALEVLLGTGRSLAQWQAIPPEGAVVSDKAKRVVLAPPRSWLETRIRARAELMLGGAALDEVQQLLARDLAADLPIMRAIGVSVIRSYLQGDLNREEAVEALTVETRRYAKRQETWFRGQMGEWMRFDPSSQSAEEMVEAALHEGVT